MGINKRMKGYFFLAVVIILMSGAVIFFVFKWLLPSENIAPQKSFSGERIALPAPETEGTYSLEEVISMRRSHRSLSADSISISDLSQLLWAAQGITDNTLQLRAAPSAGGLYPFHVFICVSNVENLDSGIYVYEPNDHSLIIIQSGEFSDQVYQSALRQDSIDDAAAIILLAADYSITRERYGDRTERYVHMEAGHIGQNIYLQATSLGLGTVSIGAFEDQNIQQIFDTGEEYQPLYLFPVGVIN